MENEQPMPVRRQTSKPVDLDFAQHQPRLKELLSARLARGSATYGMTLCTHNGRNAWKDALEELADAVLYLTQAAMEARDEGADYKERQALVARGSALFAVGLVSEILDKMGKCND